MRRLGSADPLQDPKVLRLIEEYQRQKERPEEEPVRGEPVRNHGRAVRRTVLTLLTFAAVAVLVLTLWLPVLRLRQTSMSPTLTDGNVLIFMKTGSINRGDIIAFNCGGQELVKRVIARAGDWVDIGQDGTVLLNGEPLSEPYVTEPSFGECDITLPFQVPDGQFFVMGDHRSVSLDSRSSEIGTVSKAQIIGKLICRVWPLTLIGKIS